MTIFQNFVFYLYTGSPPTPPLPEPIERHVIGTLSDLQSFLSSHLLHLFPFSISLSVLFSRFPFSSLPPSIVQHHEWNEKFTDHWG